MSHLEYGLRVGYFNHEDVEALDSKLSGLCESINKLVKSLKPQSKSKPYSQSQSASDVTQSEVYL